MTDKLLLQDDELEAVTGGIGETETNSEKILFAYSKTIERLDKLAPSDSFKFEYSTVPDKDFFKSLKDVFCSLKEKEVTAPEEIYSQLRTVSTQYQAVTFKYRVNNIIANFNNESGLSFSFT